MTRGRSPRKSDQKGVEAIFSSSKQPRQARIILGGLALFAGIFFIMVSVLMVQFHHLWGGSELALDGPLEFASIGLFVLICGGGIIISSFQLSHSPSSRATLGNDSVDSLPPTGAVEDMSPLTPSHVPSPNLNLTMIVFLQGCVLLSLYTGLVEEYQSNPTMQQWVRSWFDSGQYLLNWGSLLFSSFLLGVLFVYSFVTEDLVK